MQFVQGVIQRLRASPLLDTAIATTFTVSRAQKRAGEQPRRARLPRRNVGRARNDLGVRLVSPIRAKPRAASNDSGGLGPAADKLRLESQHAEEANDVLAD